MECISLGHPPQPCMISALLAMPPKPAQHCTIFTLQGCAPKACQAGDPHTHHLPRIHRYAGSPLHWPVPFRHAKPTLQRPLLHLS
jgi:hypothetical protein